MVAPVIVAAGVMAAGELLKGFGASRGAKKEAKAYKRASAILGQLRQTAEHVQDTADPFHKYRPEIAKRLSDIVMGRESIETDPGYNFAYDESMRGATRQMKAQGVGGGGATLAALQDRASGLASQQYGSIIERLQSLSAATPNNAIAGAQLYGQLESTRIQGQAQAAIGKGFAQSRAAGALWSGVGNAMKAGASTVMSGGFGGGGTGAANNAAANSAWTGGYYGTGNPAVTSGGNARPIGPAAGIFTE